MKHPIFYFISLSVSCCLLCHCAGNNSRCYKEYINKHRFYYPYNSDKKESDYLLFNDSIQLEYVEGELKFKSKIVWPSCSTYLLIAQWPEKGDFWNAGDTLINEIIGLNDNTIILKSSAKGFTMENKIVRWDEGK